MAYEEMKATRKTSNKDKAKNAISSALGSISKPKSTGTQKSRSTTKAKPSETKSAKASTKSGTTKTTNSPATKSTSKKTVSTSTGTKKTTTIKKSTTSEPVINITAPIIAAVTSTKKSKNKTKKIQNEQPQKKKSKSALTLFLIIFFLAIGILGGFFTTKYVCRNDVYEMVAYSNGECDLTIGETEPITSYSELGVKCVAFGKDCSGDYKVTYYFRNKLTEDEVEVSYVGEKGEGIYYAVYTAPSKKYSTVKLIRNIIVLRGEDDA